MKPSIFEVLNKAPEEMDRLTLVEVVHDLRNKNFALSLRVQSMRIQLNRYAMAEEKHS